MRKIGLSIFFVFVSFLVTYSQVKKSVNEESGDILSMEIEFLPAFDDICSLTIDTQKSQALFSIKRENGYAVMKKISYDSLYNSCDFKSLLTESKLRIYQLNRDLPQLEDGLTIRIEYRTKTKMCFIDVGNDYEKGFPNIFLCTIDKIQNSTRDTVVVHYLNQLKDYF